MGDTLVERPHPTIPDTEPTVDERAPDAPVAAGPTAPGEEAPRAPDRLEKKPPARSRGLGGAALFAIAIAVLAVAGTAIYLFAWRYEPVARRHIPANANIAVRAELAELALFGPVRTHLWARIDGDPSPESERRHARLRERTGVNIATDVREIVIATVDSVSWVMIVGGRIARGRFVKGFHDHAQQEGWNGWTLKGDVLFGPAGVVVAQADDGSIIAGNDESIVRAALPASDAHKHIGLPEEGAVVFAITRQAFTGLAGKLPVDAPALREIERAHGRVTLGSAPVITLSVEPAPGVPPAAVARDLESLFGTLRFASMLFPDVAGEQGALAAAKVKPQGDRVVVEAAWPYDGLDRGCARLGKMMR